MLALAQLRRDVSHLANRFSGRRSAPIVKVRPVTKKERSLLVARVVRETHDVVTLVLRDADGAHFDFLPGQFFTVTVDGTSRNYSASNAPGDTELHLTIKKKDGGRVSPRLFELPSSGALRVAGPYGSFVADPKSTRPVVLIAGGVGITPLMSIARTVPGEVALFYANRSPDDVVFAAALPSRVRHHHGLVDRSVIQRFVAELPASFADADVFVCGPDGMTSEVLAALPERRVYTERFTVGGRSSAKGGPRTIAIEANGREHRAVALAGATLLDAGLAAGAPMPFSCSVGGCGACRVRVLEGTIDMEEPNCLSSSEREAGYVLACVGRPAANGCRVRIEGESS
jgi:uncharacterized protein